MSNVMVNFEFFWQLVTIVGNKYEIQKFWIITQMPGKSRHTITVNMKDTTELTAVQE